MAVFSSTQLPVSTYPPEVLEPGFLAFRSVAQPIFDVSPLSYRMRAFDTTLAANVYWRSGFIDVGGANYVGPGPIVRVVVVDVI